MHTKWYRRDDCRAVLLPYLSTLYAIWETKTDVTAPSPLLRGQREGRARVVDTIRTDAGRG